MSSKIRPETEVVATDQHIYSIDVDSQSDDKAPSHDDRKNKKQKHRMTFIGWKYLKIVLVGALLQLPVAAIDQIQIDSLANNPNNPGYAWLVALPLSGTIIYLIYAYYRYRLQQHSNTSYLQGIRRWINAPVGDDVVDFDDKKPVTADNVPLLEVTFPVFLTGSFLPLFLCGYVWCSIWAAVNNQLYATNFQQGRLFAQNGFTQHFMLYAWAAFVIFMLGWKVSVEDQHQLNQTFQTLRDDFPCLLKINGKNDTASKRMNKMLKAINGDELQYAMHHDPQTWLSAIGVTFGCIITLVLYPISLDTFYKPDYQSAVLYAFSIPVTALAILGMIRTVFAVTLVFKKVAEAVEQLTKYDEWLHQLNTNTTTQIDIYNMLVGWYNIRQYLVAEHFARLYRLVSWGIGIIIVLVILTMFAIVCFVFAWHITVSTAVKYYNVVFMLACIAAASIVLISVLHAGAKAGEKQDEHKRFLVDTKLKAVNTATKIGASVVYQNKSLSALWHFCALCDCMVDKIERYEIYPFLDIGIFKVDIGPVLWKTFTGVIISSALAFVGGIVNQVWKSIDH